MRIVFMGTGGSGGPPGYAHNCFLVESESYRLVLDFGEGCSWRLEELGYTLCDIDSIYVSHLHLDHYAGLFDASVRSIARGCRRLNIVLAKPLTPLARDKLSQILPSIMRESLTIRSIDVGSIVRLGDLEVVLVPACHSIECYAIWVYSRRSGSILYTADTRPCSQLYNTITGLGEPDMVIHEAALPDSLEETAFRQGHSTPSTAIKAVRSKWPDTMITLVHLSIETWEQLRKTMLPSKVVVASDKLIASL